MKAYFSILLLFVSLLLFACGQQSTASPSPIPQTSTLLPPAKTFPTDTPTPVAEILPDIEAQRMENNDSAYDFLEDTNLRYGEDVDSIPIIYDLGDNAQMAIGQKSEGELDKYLIYVNYGAGKWLGLQVLSMENADLENTKELVFGEDDDSGTLLTLTTTRSGKVIGLLNSKADLDNSVEFFMASDIPSFFELQEDGQLKVRENIEFEVLRNENVLDLSWLKTREVGEYVLPTEYTHNGVVVNYDSSGIYSDASLDSYLSGKLEGNKVVDVEVKVGDISVADHALAELIYETSWAGYSKKGDLDKEAWRETTIRLQNGQATQADIDNLTVSVAEFITGREIPVIYFPGENVDLPTDVVALNSIEIHVVNGKADGVRSHVMHYPIASTTTWAAYVDADNNNLVIILGMEYNKDNAWTFNPSRIRGVLVKNLARLNRNMKLWDGRCDDVQASEQKCYWKGAFPPDPGSRNVYDKHLFNILNSNLNVEISTRTVK